MYTIYILKCADETLYCGITTDINKRLIEHNSGGKLAAKYTRSRTPVELVYSEISPNRSEATKREREIKKLSKISKLSLILEKLQFNIKNDRNNG